MKSPDDLRGLEPNWNGYGAPPVSDAAIAAAKLLHFVPTVHGGVQIELHVGGSDVEVEIDERGCVESVCWTAATHGKAQSES